MSDIPLELNPFLGAAPPAASSAPIANVAIERRFRDHLNQIQSRPSDQSPVSDSDHASSESPAPASEGNSFDSKHTTQDAHSSDAANNGPKKTLQTIPPRSLEPVQAPGPMKWPMQMLQVFRTERPTKMPFRPPESPFERKLPANLT
jgi:hypothetical protein